MSLASGTTGSVVTVSESNCPRAVVLNVATLLVACDGRRATPGPCGPSMLFERERTIGGALYRIGWSATKSATGEEACGSRDRRTTVCRPGDRSWAARLLLTSHVDLRCGLAGRSSGVVTTGSSRWPSVWAGRLPGGDCLLRTAFAGRFPAALTLIPASLAADDDEPCPRSCGVVGADRLDPERFDAAAEEATRGAASDPADDCTLGLRIIAGLLLDAAVAATILLPVLVVDFTPLADETGGGGWVSTSDTVGIGAGGVGFTVGGAEIAVPVGEVAEGAVDCCLADGGSGGGGISKAAAAVLADTASSTEIASSYEAGGDANRAVGRGPDVEGPLDFFRMECGGGWFEDDGFGSFLPGTSCPEVSWRAWPGSGSWLSLPRRPGPNCSESISNCMPSGMRRRAYL